MKDPKGLITRQVARILPRHPNIAVDPRLVERLIEKDNLVDILGLPPLSEINTNAVVMPNHRERVLFVGTPDFIRVAILAMAGQINPYHELQHLYRFVVDQLAQYADFGRDGRTTAKLHAIEHAIDVQHAEKFRLFNSVLLERDSAGAAKSAVRREAERAGQRVAFETSGAEWADYDANGDREGLVIFDTFEQRALELIATAFRAIYAGKDLSAAIGPHRVTVKPAPISNIDVIGVARRILDAP